VPVSKTGGCGFETLHPCQILWLCTGKFRFNLLTMRCFV
jgi:hypothetical protein